jgi:predicted transcriptional regulator
MTPTQIKAAAETAKVDLKQVLEVAGVRRETFWRWESGKFEPRQATVRKILEAIEILKK